MIPAVRLAKLKKWTAGLNLKRENGIQLASTTEHPTAYTSSKKIGRL
jgi:hypothetical protein